MERSFASKSCVLQQRLNPRAGCCPLSGLACLGYTDYVYSLFSGWANRKSNGIGDMLQPLALECPSAFPLLTSHLCCRLIGAQACWFWQKQHIPQFYCWERWPSLSVLLTLCSAASSGPYRHTPFPFVCHSYQRQHFCNKSLHEPSRVEPCILPEFFISIINWIQFAIYCFLQC